MKKLISLILTVIVLVSVCACGKKSTPGTDTAVNASVDVEVKAEFEQAINCIDNGDYKNALVILEKIPSTYSDYENVKNTYDETLEKYKKEYLDEAKKYADSDDYENALKSLENIDSRFSEDSEVKSDATKYETAWLNKQLSSFDSEKDYASAITFLTNNKQRFKNIDISAKIDYYKKLYKSQVLTEAETAFSVGDYQRSVGVLQRGLSILGNDNELQSKMEYYKDRFPVNLCDLSPYQKKGFYYSDLSDFTDVTGKEYLGKYIRGYYRSGYVSSDSEKAIGIYYLNCEYTKFSGKFVMKSPSYASIEFYDDDTGYLLARGELTEKSVDGVSFNIDLTGVKFLRIEIYSMRENVALVEARLYK